MIATARVELPKLDGQPTQENIAELAAGARKRPNREIAMRWQQAAGRSDYLLVVMLPKVMDDTIFSKTIWQGQPVWTLYEDDGAQLKPRWRYETDDVMFVCEVLGVLNPEAAVPPVPPSVPETLAGSPVAEPMTPQVWYQTGSAAGYHNQCAQALPGDKSPQRQAVEASALQECADAPHPEAPASFPIHRPDNAAQSENQFSPAESTLGGGRAAPANVMSELQDGAAQASIGVQEDGTNRQMETAPGSLERQPTRYSNVVAETQAAMSNQANAARAGEHLQSWSVEEQPAAANDANAQAVQDLLNTFNNNIASVQSDVSDPARLEGYERVQAPPNASGLAETKLPETAFAVPQAEPAQQPDRQPQEAQLQLESQQMQPQLPSHGQSEQDFPPVHQAHVQSQEELELQNGQSTAGSSSYSAAMEQPQAGGTTAAPAVANSQSAPVVEGELISVPFSAVVKRIYQEQLNGQLEVLGNGLGEVYFNSGKPYHAIANDLIGDKALLEMFLWTGGTFSFKPDRIADEISIRQPLDQCMIEGMTIFDQKQRLESIGLSMESRLARADGIANESHLQLMLSKGANIPWNKQRDFFYRLKPDATLGDVLRDCPMAIHEWIPLVYNLAGCGVIQLLSANDTVLTPLGFLGQKLSRIEHFREHLIDPTTHLFKYEYLLIELEKEFYRYMYYSWPLSLIVLQLGTKDESDELQPLPQEALVTAATRIQLVKRPLDIAAHFESRHFALLLPNTSGPSAAFVANRIHQVLTTTALAVGVDKRTLALSMGVSSSHSQCMTLEDIIVSAKSLMKEALNNRYPIMLARSTGK